MKIVIFDGTFKTTTFINRLIEGLSKRHEIFVLGYNEDISNKLKNVRYIPLGSNQNQFSFFKISFIYALKSRKLLGFFNYFFLRNREKIQERNLFYVLNKIQPDIIHLQWLSNIEVFENIIKETKYKIVLSQRGFHINVRPFIDEKNLSYLEKWFPKIDGFHSVSRSIKENSKKIYNYHSKIDAVVYSGLNLNKLKFKKFKKKNEQFNILSVGRNHWKKGFFYAIKAMKNLSYHIADFTYTIIGVKPTESLLYLINELDLHDKIKFRSKVSQQEVYQIMYNSDILLLPSLEEGIANVCIESMALGLPVISTDCGGMKELIDDNINGFIIPSRDSKLIEKKIIHIYKMSEEKINIITSAARAKIEKQHSEETMIEQMERLYNLVYERD